MSQENVELVRMIYDGWSRGDFSVGRDLMTADFEWQQHAEAVEPGSRRGAAIVVVLAHNRARARGSGIELDEAFGYVWTIRAGRLARVEVYATERHALEAAGLSE